MDITAIASNVIPGENGILFAQHAAHVAYPAEGNDWCRQIEDTSYWFAHRNRCIIASMRLFPPGGTVFDVGGGNGIVAAAMTNEGFDACVVEPGLEGARNARARGVPHVVCAALEDVEFVRASLPAVGLFDVLEHIEQDVQFLDQLNGLLYPEGRLYLTVPAYQLLWSTDDDFAHHARRYTLRSIDKRLRAAGFDIEFATYFFVLLPLPIFLMRTVPSRLRRSREITLQVEKADHTAPGGLAGNALRRALNWEAERIARGKPCPFGSSCLVVARRAA